MGQTACRISAKQTYAPISGHRGSSPPLELPPTFGPCSCGLHDKDNKDIGSRRAVLLLPRVVGHPEILPEMRDAVKIEIVQGRYAILKAIKGRARSMNKLQCRQA